MRNEGRGTIKECPIPHIVSLKEFLEQKSLYYDKIDFNTVKVAWEFLRSHIKLPFVIHIIGTNGKGSTGRFLAYYLNESDFSVIHYTSPHILRFNERIWINGGDVSDEELELAHNQVYKIVPQYLLDKLTYFEYTTLLALNLSSGFDYLVLEAGLGGEFDATNIVKNDLTLVTTIDYDHQAFLGDTIEEIAGTKMRSCDTAFVLGKQIHKEVQSVKQEVLKQKWEIDFNDDIILPEDAKHLPHYLQDNLKLALTALKYLKVSTGNLKPPTISGRCQKIKHNITIDVGHNPLAAKVLSEHFTGTKVNLIYNSYQDKDYRKVLKILKPVVKEVFIIFIDDDRIAKKEDIVKVCNELSLPVSDFAQIDDGEEYLVFGSFLVVEKFLAGNI